MNKDVRKERQKKSQKKFNAEDVGKSLFVSAGRSGDSFVDSKKERIRREKEEPKMRKRNEEDRAQREANRADAKSQRAKRGMDLSWSKYESGLIKDKKDYGYKDKDYDLKDRRQKLDEKKLTDEEKRYAKENKFNIFSWFFEGKLRLLGVAIAIVVMLISFFIAKAFFWSVTIVIIIALVVITIVRSRDATWKAKGLAVLIGFGLSFGSIFLFYSGGFIFDVNNATVVGGVPIANPAGFKIGLGNDGQTIATTDPREMNWGDYQNTEVCVDYDYSTTSYATYTGDYTHINWLNRHSRTSTTVNFDVDGENFGVPNVSFGTMGGARPADAYGNELENYLYQDHTINGLIKDDVEYDFEYYTTYFNQEVNIQVSPDFKPEAIYWVGLEAKNIMGGSTTSELAGAFHKGDDVYSLGGIPLLARIIFKFSIIELTMGGISGYDYAKNLFLNAYLNNNQIDATGLFGWAGTYEENGINTQYTVTDHIGSVAMYSSCHDALLKINPLLDLNTNQVDFDNDFYNEIYIPIDVSVLLGYNFKIFSTLLGEDFLKWNTFTINELSTGEVPISIATFTMSWDFTFGVAMSYAWLLDTDDVDHALVNPFSDGTIYETGSNFNLLNWIKNVWSNLWYDRTVRTILFIVLGLIVVIIGFIIYNKVKGKPMLIDRSGSLGRIGGSGGSSPPVTINISNFGSGGNSSPQKKLPLKRKPIPKEETKGYFSWLKGSKKKKTYHKKKR